MGNATITHSAIWLALAACYDSPPDIQLRVTRSDTANLSVRICDSLGLGCKCDTGTASSELGLFTNHVDLSRRAAIYVNSDVPQVTVALQITRADGTELGVCQVVTLIDTMLVREVNVDDPFYWKCTTPGCDENATPCETTCPR